MNIYRTESKEQALKKILESATNSRYIGIAKGILEEIKVKFDSEELEELIELLKGENDFCFNIDGGEYRIINDYIIDQVFEEYMDNYIDENIINQIPQNLQYYFDSEMFINDTKIEHGYSVLATYDNNWYEVNNWYIFRTN